MKPDWYTIITRAVNEGVNTGWLRAHHYEDNPDPDTIKDHISDAVINSISEVIDWQQQ